MADRRVILTGAAKKTRAPSPEARAPAPPPGESWAAALTATGVVMALIGLLDVVDTVVFVDWAEPGALGRMTRPMVGRLTMPAAGLGIMAAGAAARPRALVDAALGLASLLMMLVGLATLSLVARGLLAELEEGMMWPIIGAMLRVSTASALFAWIFWATVRRLMARRQGASGAAGSTG